MQIITNELQKELKEHGSYQFPLLVSQELLSRYETGAFLWHWHPEIELTLIQKGEILYRVNNHSFHLHEGQALFGNANALHAGSMINHQDCSYMSVTFDPKLIYGYENSLIYEKYMKPIVQNPSLPAIALDLTSKWHNEAILLLNQIIDLYAAQSSAYEIEVVCRLQEFWKLLFLNLEPESPLSVHDQINYERIRRILVYINRNYTSKLTLADIAGEIHLCTSECSRLFKQYMKESLFEFILKYRIEKSLSYLANTSYSISEIAALTGFQDSNYFSKVFLRFKGCPPSAYRKRVI